MPIWKRWKRVRTKYAKLRRLGLNHDMAMTHANARVAYWRAVHTPGVHAALNNEYLEHHGLLSFSKYYQEVSV